MATIYIDKQPYQTHEEQNLLQACLSLGFDLPYFCWHPAMHSVGACRQCAVKCFAHANDPRGRIVMACMTPVKDGMHISIGDSEAVEFRRSVIEWLMLNHPHDCPVCDEGGECHLQDMTVMTGHEYRRTATPKRTHRNQDLGPFVTHEMNRCIQCYRCVRFYRDFAGGDDLEVLGWHDSVYFGRSREGTLRSPFSGNLVEVCPTGVFTDKSLARHYTRKWDLQTAPSVCVHCGLGCNTIPGERYGTLRRVYNRFNSQVNGYFLCDRGRYGYEFVNSPLRVRQAMRRAGGQLEPIEPAAAMEELAALVGTGKRLVGIGSPRASVEVNYALRTLVGAERFFSGASPRERQLAEAIVGILQVGPARTPSLREIESADAVLVLGEDPTNAAPMLDYALRQAIRQKSYKLADELHIDRWNDAPVREVMQGDRSPLFIATPAATELDRVATGTVRAAPQGIAALGRAVAAAVGCAGSALKGQVLHTQSSDPAKLDAVARIAEALRNAERPVVISGTSCGSLDVIRAAGEIAAALCRAGKPCGLFYTVPECNSLGLAMMSARSLDQALTQLQAAPGQTLIVLENDLFRRAPAAFVDSLLKAAGKVVVLDYLRNATVERAALVLPAATFAESDGTLINNEGRAQRSFRVYVPPSPIQDSWRWLRDAMVAAGQAEMAAWQDIDGLVESMVRDLPLLAGVVQAAPPADFRVQGMHVPRQPHRYSGRTAMTANLGVHELQPPTDADSPLAFSMEGYDGQPPSALLPRYWAPGWNSVQALNKFQQEVGSLLRQSMPGVRLIEPGSLTTEDTEGTEAGSRNDKEKQQEAGAFASCASQGRWLVVPSRHVFGSDELSVHSPGIDELSPSPYMAMNPADAARSGAREGQTLTVVFEEAGKWGQAPFSNGENGASPQLPCPHFSVPVKLDASLPDGVAAMPVGLRGVAFVDLPAWAGISVAAPGKGGGT